MSYANKEDANAYRRLWAKRKRKTDLHWKEKQNARCREYSKTKYENPAIRERIKSAQKKYYTSEHGKRRVRDNHLKRLYGITIEDFERMYEAQGGKCAICETAPKRLVMDHCHAKGHVRKLVCDLCNRAIAVVENSDLVDRVRAYLGEF